MIGLIKKIFLGLVTDLVNGSNHTKCVSLSNQKCMTQPTLLTDIIMNTVKNFITLHLRLN